MIPRLTSSQSCIDKVESAVAVAAHSEYVVGKPLGKSPQGSVFEMIRNVF